jgi:tetratricopeptide (TPR) repeat protein
MKYGFVVLRLFVFAFLYCGLAHGQDKAADVYQTDTVNVQSDGHGMRLGTVHFPVSCSEAAHQHTERGLALLHHMTYEGARAAFAAATKVDPNCAMGYWGQAMSFIHPLWSDQPSQADFERGRAFLNKAKNRGKKTERELAYIASVDAYYAMGRRSDEKANLASFEKAWQRVYQQFPEDPEAACFYALAHIATVDPANMDFAKQRYAAEIAKQVLARIPDHPGAHHYFIHAHDYPSLAQDALEVARSYGEIATNVPHALHMPSHIFTRLGLWQESIVMNQRAAAISLAYPVDGKISLHYLHALDYLAYAHLQRADDGRAKEILDTISSLEKLPQIHIASAYTIAAVPARVALERQQWAEAAMLKSRTPNEYPWNEFPEVEAITHFARALGAARSGNEQVAHQALDQLTILHDRVVETSVYWAKQIDIQRLSVQAWLMYYEGEEKGALEKMRRAAEMETETEKHPVSPGMILPAQELFADMLLEVGRYQLALAQYQAALVRSPNRFNSLYGAARAAELAGERTKAAFYFNKLIEITAVDAKRTQLQSAKNFMETN